MQEDQEIENANQESTDEIVEETEGKKEKKKKKVVRRRKSKKEKEKPLISAVRLAVESGKVDFGARTGIKTKAKLFVVAGNAPDRIKEKVSTYAKTSDIPLITFDGSSMELGSVCGRPFPVSVLSVYDEGSSNILELAKKK